MDWRQVWRWLREIEWAGSLARQLWAAVAAVGVLGSATMRTLWEDPVRLVFFILSSALLIVSVVSFWSGYRRLRNDRKTVADDVLEKAEEKTEENLRQAQEKSRKLEEELAKERQEVEQLQTKVDLLKTKGTLFQQQEEEKTRGLEEATRKLNDKSEKLAECERNHGSLSYEFGRWLIDRCGTDESIRNRSVVVQFVGLIDRDRAEKTKELFSISWRVKDIEHIQWKRNPDSDHRIVIFSNDETAHRLREIINGYNLLDGEQIGRMDKQSDMEDDVTIIIFTEKGVRQ